MTELMESPALLLESSLFLLLASLVVMTWGRSLPRRGDWVLGLGLVVLVVAGGSSWSVLAAHAFAPQEWVRGWIWPHEESGALTMGVLRDTSGSTMGLLASIVALGALLGTSASAREQRIERFYASLGLGAAGVALAWFALTPWLALTGVALVILGGFLALGAPSELPGQAALATRFGWERSWGLILSFLGLCVLAGGRAPLTLTHTLGLRAADQLGMILFFVGAFAQTQPFPMLGWVMSESEAYGPARAIVSQVFPGWAVFALLLRFEPQFRESGLYPDLGWLGIASALLASVSGLLSSNWRLSLGAWLSAGFSLSVAVLAFVGPSPAFSLWVGLGLGASALSAFGVALEEGGSAGNTHRKRAVWAKTGCVLSAAAGTGCIGFYSAGGLSRMASLLWTQPSLAAGVLSVFFVFAFLGWKVGWQAAAVKNHTQAPWNAVLMPFLPVILSLGVIWTGTASGGAVPGSPDRLFGSLVALMFGSGSEAWGDEMSISPACGAYWVLAALAAFAGYWTAGKLPDFWPNRTKAAPRFTAFVLSGYGADAVVSKLRAGLVWIGGTSARLSSHRAWEAWLPSLIGRGAVRSAKAIAMADHRLSRGIGGLLRSWVEVPSKGLQAIQNGDVQWYVFFALGSGIAILAHFMIKT